MTAGFSNIIAKSDDGIDVTQPNTSGIVTERLNELQREFKQSTKRFAHPLTAEDSDQLVERRKAIREEGQVLTKSLDVLGPDWLEVT